MLERGNGSSKAGEKPTVNSQCPTLEQWNHIQSVETISEVDPEIVSHVEYCQRCLARLEQMTSASRRVFDNLLNVVDTATTEKFPITVPKGYELAGEPIFGGRGIVIKLKEIGSNSYAALKVPNQRWKTTAFERKKLIAESEAISVLDHPGIVKLISVVMSEDQPAILMEWVEGSNLRESLTVREPNIDETLQLILSLTDAVSHAHERGILHRDIKPSNIMVCGNGFNQIKLCDFGLAKMKAGRPGWSSGTELIGTPGYMAPETIRNEIGKVGPAVDVFSIGVVMYHLLTGKMPFDGINPISLGIQVLYHEPQAIRSIRNEIPLELEAICLKCLSKEPDERYPDAIALRADLDRFMKGKPVHATRSNTFQRLKRWARREPRLAALTGAFVCFMAITIAILGILLDKSRASEEKAIQNANQARMNGEIASRNAKEAERRLVESVKAMSLASPVFKRILNEYRLNPDEIKKVTEFAKLRENLDAEPIDLKERLNHHFLTLELADCLRRIKGEERNAIELAALARQKIGKLISEDGEAASKAEYGSIPSENFRISVLEKALLRYGQACSQLYGSYPSRSRIGLGEIGPSEDPKLDLIREAINAADRALQLNPRLDEAKMNEVDYYYHFILYEIANGKNEKAIEMSKESLKIAEGLLLAYPNDILRWNTAIQHRSALAKLHLEPPADFIKSAMTLDLLRERLRNHLKKKEVLDHFHFIVWRELLWSYQPYLAQGWYAEALSIIDELIRSTANSSLQEINEQNLLFDLNQLKIEKLCIMKLMNVAMELIEKEELVIQSQINQLKESDQKYYLLAILSLFSPIQNTKNIEIARNYLNRIKSESEPSRNLLELCRINSGETSIEKNYITREVISKMRFLTNGSIILKLMFEVERLMKSGQKEKAKRRLELLDQWFANDKLIPAHVIVLLNRLKTN